jgi:hypothetical protein
VGQKPRMNPMHRDADCSDGWHLFQELSTLARQLAYTLLLRWAVAKYSPCFPAGARRDRVSPWAVRGPILAPHPFDTVRLPWPGLIGRAPFAQHRIVETSDRVV